MSEVGAKLAMVKQGKQVTLRSDAGNTEHSDATVLQASASEVESMGDDQEGSRDG